MIRSGFGPRLTAGDKPLDEFPPGPVHGLQRRLIAHPGQPTVTRQRAHRLPALVGRLLVFNGSAKPDVTQWKILSNRNIHLDIEATASGSKNQ
jgi:hypothetical protein